MSTPEAYNDQSGLEIYPHQLEGIEHYLGPEGPGAFVINEVISPERLKLLQEEIYDPLNVPWRDNHHVFTNVRGIEVVENHLVFALKLHRGDQTFVNRVPELRRLAADVESFFRGLSDSFPILSDWTADEMSMHRYDDPHVGLSFHKDNPRFRGMIAIIELEGERDFAVKTPDGEEHFIPMWPGRMIINRAQGFYDAPVDENGKSVNICPDHGVYNLRTPTSTSFIVRANNDPSYQVKGFEYDNWSGPIK